MAKIDLNPGETILKEGTVATIERGFMLRTGTGFLTDQRFVRYRSGVPFWLAGLLSLLFGGKIDIEIPLASIRSLARGKFGRNTNVLVIATAEGQEHTLQLGFDEWLTAFRDVLGRGGRRLTEDGEGRWIAGTG